MPDRNIAELVSPRKHLWWWVKDPERLSEESVVEGILAYGDMEDVHDLFNTLGKEKVRSIFLKQIKKQRCNYRPQTINFFLKVFSANV